MKAKKFELFLGCLGNGTTVCNKAVEENGDYKMIAHISNWGHIRWYVPSDYCPKEELQRIEKYAEKQHKEFMELWKGLSLIDRYGKLLDNSPVSVFRKLKDMGKASLEEKVRFLEKYLKSYMER